MKQGPLENEYDPEINKIENESPDWPRGLNFTSSREDHSSDIYRGETENFGTDIEEGQFFRNNEDTQGYGDLQTPSDVGVFKTIPEEQIAWCIYEKPRSFR